MTRFITRKKIAAATAATALGVGGVIAYAAWTSSGSGSGTISAGNASALVVADAHSASTLYPNGTGDLVVTLTNNNPYNVSVTAIAQGALSSGSATPAAITVDNGHSSCNVSSVTLTAPALSGVVVGKNGGTYTLTLHNAVAMDNSAVDACQGATFTVPVVATAASSASAAASPNSGSF